MPETAGRRVLVAGATGLVGRECLLALVADPGVESVTALVRRLPPKPPAPGSKLRWVATDFGQLGRQAGEFAGICQVFCALGTTLAKAGSRAAFRRVDVGYPIAIAQQAIAAGATHFLLVSAASASARSPFFYSRVKAELEQAILAMPWRSVTIARPSLLLGEREDLRLGEELAKGFGWAFPRRWRPVQARDVAATLVAAARDDAPGIRIVESRQMQGAAAA